MSDIVEIDNDGTEQVSLKQYAEKAWTIPCTSFSTAPCRTLEMV